MANFNYGSFYPEREGPVRLPQPSDELPEHRPFSVLPEHYIGAGTGRFQEFTSSPTSPEEEELLKLLIEEIRSRSGQSALRRDLISRFLERDFTGASLRPEEASRLDELTGIYTRTRTAPLYEQADIAERNLRQRFAAQGILDSSVAGDTQVDLQKELSKRISDVGEQAALFRYGTEQDIRSSALAEQLQKIGVISQATDPKLAENTLAILTGQRNEESNRALQIALANAQAGGGDGGGGGFFDFLTAIPGLVLGSAAGAFGTKVGSTAAGKITKF